jgi:hypothetical protein
MSAPEARERAKGFVLVLVVDQSQAGDETASLARVCADYDVTTATELQEAIRLAAVQACNQLLLNEALTMVLRRARAAWN